MKKKKNEDEEELKIKLKDDILKAIKEEMNKPQKKNKK